MRRSMLQQAAEYYCSKGDSFWEVVRYYSLFGMVYFDARCFFMARPCNEEAPFEHCDDRDHETWYVEFVYGDGALARMLDIGASIGIKRIGFTRDNEEDNTRFYDIDEIRRKANGLI